MNLNNKPNQFKTFTGGKDTTFKLPKYYNNINGTRMSCNTSGRYVFPQPIKIDDPKNLTKNSNLLLNKKVGYSK